MNCKTKGNVSVGHTQNLPGRLTTGTRKLVAELCSQGEEDFKAEGSKTLDCEVKRIGRASSVGATCSSSRSHQTGTRKSGMKRKVFSSERLSKRLRTKTSMEEPCLRESVANLLKEREILENKVKNIKLELGLRSQQTSHLPAEKRHEQYLENYLLKKEVEWRRGYTAKLRRFFSSM